MIDKEINEIISFEDYTEKKLIEDVYYIYLKRHESLEGSFTEIFRLYDGIYKNMKLAQISISTAVPGRINAFHIHPKRNQNEIWCCINGMMKVVLVDLRCKKPYPIQSFILDAHQPILLYIPSGVAHGYKAGVNGATLLYAVDDMFDINDPNEGRIPWDYFGVELWEENKG